MRTDAMLVCTRVSELHAAGLGIVTAGDQTALCTECGAKVAVRDDFVRGLPDGDYPIVCSCCARAHGWKPRSGNRAERRHPTTPQEAASN